MTITTQGTSTGRTRSTAVTWSVCGVVLLVLNTWAGNAGALTSTVNPPEAVSPELAPYVEQFAQVLRARGFTIVDRRDPENLQLRIGLTTSTGSITISSELLQGGKALVTTSIRNRTFFKESAIAGTVRVTAQQFSSDVARYVLSAGGIAADAAEAGAPAAIPDVNAPTSASIASPPAASSVASAPQGRAPVRSANDVKVYFHPPDKRYEEIGLLEASSKNSWSFSAQGKVDKVVERLKAQAAKMGANGVLLVGMGTEYGGSINTTSATVTGYGNTAYGNAFGSSAAVTHKAGSAIAIYVYETEQSASPADRSAPSTPVDVGSRSPPTATGVDRQRTDRVYDAILKLDELRKRGLITDAEFNAEKQKVLAGD